MEDIEQKSKKERKRIKRGVVVEGLSSAKKKMREERFGKGMRSTRHLRKEVNKLKRKGVIKNA